MPDPEITDFVERVTAEARIVGLSSAERAGGFVVFATFDDDTTVVVETIS